MQYTATQTGAKPVTYEPPDELTQKELERGIELLRKVKRGEVKMGTAKLVDGALYLEGWKRAA